MGVTAEQVATASRLAGMPWVRKFGKNPVSVLAPQQRSGKAMR